MLGPGVFFKMLLSQLFVVHSLRTYYLVTCLILKFCYIDCRFLSSLYIMDNNPQSDVWLVNVFLPFWNLAFHLNDGLLCCSEAFWLPLRSHWLIVDFNVFTIRVLFKKFLLYSDELKNIHCFLFYSIQGFKSYIRSFISLELKFV